MTHIACIFLGQRYELGDFPTEQAVEFHRWWRAYCPNRHYLFEDAAPIEDSR